MSLIMIKPGLFSTIQDTGRQGFQKEGIIVSGAMDMAALRIANLLVGNPEGEAAIETTLIGPDILFEEDHLIAITGSQLLPKINGEPVPLWKPVYVRKSSLLQFGPLLRGCRAYLTVSGGFAIPAVMGSRSTYLRAGIGGLHGKRLHVGDEVPCNGPTPTGQRLVAALSTNGSRAAFEPAKWFVSPFLSSQWEKSPTIRAVPGPEYDLFSESSQASFWQEPFQVTPQSDRMGYRLKGPALFLNDKIELLSSAVTFGTVQVPPEGNPIVLMADHQTTGGYPRIAQVITADFSTLAQLPPGRTVQFRQVTLAEAQQLYVEQERRIEQIKRAITIKIASTT